MTSVSAKGTRMNRRGLETRLQLLENAVAYLSEGGPESVSANAIARRTGVTWGVIQHQFGGVDGLWAAVLDHISAELRPLSLPAIDATEISARVREILDRFWYVIDLPGPRAIYTLREGLPRSIPELEESMPRTAAALADWDAWWTKGVRRAFTGLEIDEVRLRRVIGFMPGVMMGLRSEQHLATYADLEDARTGLTEAIAGYLAGS